MRVKGEVKASTIFDVTFEGPQCAVNPVFRPVRDGLSKKGTILVRNYIPNSASQVKNNNLLGNDCHVHKVGRSWSENDDFERNFALPFAKVPNGPCPRSDCHKRW